MIYYHSVTEPYQHGIILSSGNEDGLCKQSKLATLTDEVTQWLDENIGINKWRFDYSAIISFETKEDAMAFKLMWS